MRISRWVVGVAIVVASVGLTGCAQDNSPAIAPVTKDVGDLQGATVDLVVGQSLDINTGDLAVDSYSGKVDDTGVAAFSKGRKDGGTTYNPGVKGLSAGSTKVVLSNSNGGIQDVTFTVDVAKN
ncbi:hypothetical protein E6C70_11935 [Glaciibacter flavus]|uniref:Lipoprotein n=1 Tax=Orlajensenia flava TaxID=2565934 RepID=A0A4S4FPJ9_9MICO|nr:hypothetical protein [Glaciibacter flavus]THG32470.1 hypothetical protein E6C70_11935 [Glaciibacter flavus]